MDQQWLHYTLYPDEQTRLDQVVCDVVAPAVARATAAGPPARWFFLRYTDELGVHVRLRFGGPGAVVDAVYREIDPVLRRALAAMAAPGAAPAGCQHGFYEPELDKYGGPLGVGLAETLFQASSESVLALFADAGAAMAGHRRALALGMMRAAARAAVGDADAAAFWERYEWHWSGGAGPAAGARRTRYRQLAVARAGQAREQLAAVAADPAAGPLLAGYADALRAHRAGLAAHGDPIPAATAAFHHAHLTNNRLGIPTVEEGYLARLLIEAG